MRKILENFYLGNLTPSERQMPPRSNLQRAVNRVSQCERKLIEQLNDSEQALLKEMVDAQQDIDSITACENFILGFRLGVRLMAECMDEDDGDTRALTDNS